MKKCLTWADYRLWRGIYALCSNAIHVLETNRNESNVCPLRTRAIPEPFCGGDSVRRGAISSVCTFTFLPFSRLEQSVQYCAQTSVTSVGGKVTTPQQFLATSLRRPVSPFLSGDSSSVSEYISSVVMPGRHFAVRKNSAHLRASLQLEVVPKHSGGPLQLQRVTGPRQTGPETAQIRSTSSHTNHRQRRSARLLSELGSGGQFVIWNIFDSIVTVLPIYCGISRLRGTLVSILTTLSTMLCDANQWHMIVYEILQMNKQSTAGCNRIPTHRDFYCKRRHREFKMVTTFTYKPSLITDPQTHTPPATDRTDNNTLRR